MTRDELLTECRDWLRIFRNEDWQIQHLMEEVVDFIYHAPPDTTSTRTRIQVDSAILRAEIGALERLLDELPVEQVITRTGLEERKQRLLEELSAMEGDRKDAS